MRATLNDLLGAKGVSEPLREAVKALIDRLEAAEKERDALRAEIEQMEKQEPYCWTTSPPTGHFSRFKPEVDLWISNGWKTVPLYALPGAQPAPSVPDAVIKAAMEAQREGCAGIVLQAAHIAADYNNLREYELLRALAMEVAKAPEAKP